jgi:hypothetical protein
MQKKKIIKTNILSLILIVGIFLILGVLLINKNLNIVSTYAETADENGLYYTLNEDGLTFSVTGCDLNIVTIEIPSTYNNGTKEGAVTAIASEAFLKHYSLKSVIIPNTIIEIGASAFKECYSLREIILSENLLIIEESAFRLCYNLISISFPESLTKIGSSAFWFCSNLTSISISNNPIDLGAFAFDETAWYNSQPEGVVYIGKIACSYKGEMPSNTSIELLSSTLSVASSIFSGFSNLTSITIPDSVVAIGDKAFQIVQI